MRKNIVAGNWKMNTNLEEAKSLISATDALLQKKKDINCEVIISPPFPFITTAVECVKESVMQVAAQNCSEHTSGAFTGEVSVDMIKSTGATHIIIGHSERREYFNETSLQLAKKVDLCLGADLTPVFCCGESLEIRESGAHEDFVCTQLSESLFHLSPEMFNKVVIAYEPVWAIGTGVTASSQQAQDMHFALRSFVESKYGRKIAEDLTILYGGSCKPSNAQELFNCPDVDGGLIGGAALKAEDFVGIISAF